MKIEKLIAAVSLVIHAAFAALSVQAQGTFQNLDFEQANPISVGDPYDPGLVTAASALPYWTVAIGGTQQTQIDYNEISTGAPAVTLVSASNPYFPAIDGNYSVWMLGSGFPEGPSISQTGLIPAGTQALLFKAQQGGPTLEVLVGTQIVPFAAIGSGQNYTLFGANISAWAGDTEQLTFLVPGDNSGPNYWTIDDISFSPTPEPSIVALSVIGGMLFAVRKWFARR